MQVTFGGPRYEKNPCESCTYLGTYEEGEGVYDLYFCSLVNSIVVQFGSENWKESWNLPSRKQVTEEPMDKYVVGYHLACAQGLCDESFLVADYAAPIPEPKNQLDLVFEKLQNLVALQGSYFTATTGEYDAETVRRWEDTKTDLVRTLRALDPKDLLYIIKSSRLLGNILISEGL